MSNLNSISLISVPGRVQNFLVKANTPVEVLATYDVPKDPNGVIEAYYISYYGITDKVRKSNRLLFLRCICSTVLDKHAASNSPVHSYIVIKSQDHNMLISDGAV